VRRVGTAFAAACGLALLISSVSCGGKSPMQPSPGGGNGGNQQPPPNNLPVIESITVQGTRAKEPPAFADVNEAVNVTAKVRDDETPVEQLQYQWSAPVGAFTGTGASVTWTAPAETQGEDGVAVTITLKVIEKYGQPGGPQSFQHDVTQTTSVSLHDSIEEVGDMARQFLIDFSDTNNKNADYIMRNFGRSCPNQSDVADERSDVINHFTNYSTVDYRIGPATVTVNFGGTCPFPSRPGKDDACAAVPAFWDSIDVRNNRQGSVDGIDYLSASYSTADARWWLCSSTYKGRTVSGATLRDFIR
jgi:hypothetical protein